MVINLPELLLYQFYLGVYQRRYALAVGKDILAHSHRDLFGSQQSRKSHLDGPGVYPGGDGKMGREVVEKVPPGPQNPLGKFWIGTSAEGVGIHATNRPWSIGQSVSHGCIRMLPGEIAQLFPQVEVGALVKIIYQPVKMALTREGRIFLEAHPDIYGRKFDYRGYVKKLARDHHLEDRLDWQKVDTILKIKEGIAKDVSKDPVPTRSAAASSGSRRPRDFGLSPLQSRDTRIE
jgi:L,D-transpeptidase ErfK/SrfK